MIEHEALGDSQAFISQMFTILEFNEYYYWRVKVQDTTERWSAWTYPLESLYTGPRWPSPGFRYKIDDGEDRPENVIGSYAIYHKTKVNYCTNCGTLNYATGKFGHFYRPKIIDKDGNWVWGILVYTEGKFTV